MVNLSRAASKALFLAAALFSLAAFFSCDNSSDSSGYSLSQEQAASPASPAAPVGGEAAAPEIQFITFKGSVQAPGALPASYAKALEGLGFGGTEEGVEGLSKSARPDVTADGASIEHFAVATPNVGEPVEGTFASPSSTTFEMPLAIGKTWNIVCGIRNVSGDKKIIMSDSFQIEVTVSNSVLSHVFTLTPYTEVVEGVAPIGNVALTVNFEGSAYSVSASWEDPAGGLPALTVESPADSPSFIKASNVPVGNHRLAIFFRDLNGVSVYESVQVVTVLNGLTTETWMPESGEAAILSSGHFVVDNDVIKGASSDRIYVGKPAALASNDSVRASDSNSGSAYSPLEHLQAAFNKIKSAGSGSKDFKIFVSGEVEGTATLDAVRGTHARSVTIEGLDSPDESEKPKSVLNGLKEGSVVTVASNVPVTIKNLQITNGRSSAGGGGISMVSGAKVTLGKGALIGKPTDQAIMDYNDCGNSGNKGGGILVNGASLVLESGSSVQGNYGSGGLEVGSGGGGISVINGGSLVIGEGAEVCKNASSGPGGGIFVGDNSSVTVNGGIVNQNKASNNGGGFYLDAEAATAPARLELNGGQINQNAAIGKQYIGLAKGGGIYASQNGQIQIKGGQINKNTAGKQTTSTSGHTYGAGVYIHASTAQMTNGEISENEGYAVRDMDRHCGSAVAVMEDAEFSISGGTISKNKIAKGEKLGAIYVKSEKKTVGGSDVVVKGTLKISGSASIPYDSGDNAQNYVYLEADDSRSGISEQAKERIYSPIKVGNLTGGSVAASVYAQNWLRGKQVLLADGVSDLTPLKDKLSFTEAGISFAVPTADVTKANLMSPFYVSDTGGSDDISCPGTYDRPYKTFAHAIGEIVSTNAAADYTIRIKGKVSGAQAVVADTITSANCAGLTIEGTTALGDSGLPADSLDRGLSSESAQQTGNALVIDTDVPVTIQNLKITGGKITSAADPGAGVSIKKSGADVRLGNGAQVVGNSGASGSNGGGVYVAAGARLFMYGKSLIGDLTQATATGASTAEGANYIFGNGGGIYNLGSVYIGYERLVSGNPLQRDMAEGFGVRRNYSNSDDGGGGIYSKGTLYFNSGSVSYNKSAGIAVDGGSLYIKGGEICANANSYGAGVYLNNGSAEMSGGTIGGSEAKANSATNGGGAVYVNFNKTFKMTGGTISYNKQTGSVGGGGGGGAVYLMMSSGATSTYGTFEMTGGVLENNSAASGNGGAVFNQGILKLSGKASIPYAEGKNDVFLYGTRRITADSFDASAPETVATITMPAENWKRGRVVLDGSVNDEIASKFKTIDPDFNITAKSSTEGTIDADIVVAAGGKTGGDAAGARGTYSDPYGSVEAAIAYGIDASHTAITIKGSVGKQKVSSWPASGGAAGVGFITLKGKDSTAKIDAGGATDAGSALTVNASGKTVTITDLTITGGNATNGGGINLYAGTVTLTNGANIVGNCASSYGGGVYIDTNGTLFMNGTSIVGDTIEEVITWTLNHASSNDTSKVNYAPAGGGIYSKGKLYLGCNTSGTADTGYALSDGYGVRHNNSNAGGGINISGGVFKAASGQVSYNKSGADGAGICVAVASGTITLDSVKVKNNKANSYGGALFIDKNCTVNMSGSTVMSNNEASTGGAVYIRGTFNMSAGTIGGESFAYKNSATNAGAVYVDARNSGSVEGIFNMTGGSIAYNECLNNGGAITISSDTSMDATFNMSGGSISNNRASSNGGAILQAGVFNISGSASIPYGVTSGGTTTKSPGYNDVYLFEDTNTITVASALTPPSGVTAVATITPNSYSRGRDILSSTSANAINLSNAIGKFKLSQDDSGWDRDSNLATSDTAKKVWITSPIYVVGASGTDSTKPDGFEYGKTTGANGTKSSPYASVADALTCADLADIKEITVAGTLVGAQQEIASPSVDITLKGYKAAGETTSSAKIQRWSSKKTFPQDAGSVLIVNASGKTVTITDLTLSYGASSNGGGIYITNGTVKLGDYAKISENYAGNKGGGLYVSSGATLFMYGKALIGDKLSTDTGITTATGQNYGNAAPYQGGGGIYNEGSVYIGYNGFKADGTTLQESAIDAGYGIIRCYTMNQDGGAIYNNGTLKIKSGSISYNRTANSGGAVVCVADATISGGTFESNYAGVSGGAVSIKASKTLTINGDAIFKNNQAESSGGAISNLGTLTMTAGTIGESGALNRIAEGKTGTGGAISQKGTFNISGTAYIYPGSEKSNDVYLTSNKSVSVDGSWSGSQSSSSKMTLTPPTWKRGTTVVSKGSSSSAVDITTDIVSKFSVSDSEWSAVLAGSGASAAGKIDAEIWLSSSDETDATRSTGVGQGSDSNSGTKSKPYATLDMAVTQCWKGPNDTVVESGVTKGRTIHIDGTVTAPSGTSHTIRQNFTTSKASAITLLGSAKSGSTPTLKAADKQVLSISTSVPVRIQKLKITGGSTTSNGAGIYATAAGAKLTLGEGAEVSGNTSTGGNGGGVWFCGTGNTSSAMGTLIMESTAKIQGNMCGSGNGGGIYLKNANLYMTGSALVGDNSSYDTGATSSSYSNLAQNGGGIFADENAAVYIGYASDGSISAMTSGYGVCHNYAQISGTLGGNGGGIFLNSSTSELYMGSGSISKNGAGADGGGIWNGGKVFLHTKAMVGDSRTSAATASENSNVAAGNGGGIYSGSASYVALGYKSVSGTSWTAQTLNDGYGVVGNFASEGGGVYGKGASGSPGELRMGSGNISANCANHESSNYSDYGGGGVYTKSTYFTVYMSGGEISNNKAAAFGGGAFISGSFYMSGNAAIGKMAANSGRYAQNTVGSFSNWAVRGGGIYIVNNATLYMGYKGYNDFDDSFSGGIAYNWANLSGGGAHNKGAIYMAGGTIKSNSAPYSGGAVCQSNWFYMGGGATIPAGSELSKNGIYLNTASAKVGGFTSPTRPLTGSGVVATIDPNSYSTSSQVLDNNIKASANRFSVFPKNGEAWTIDSGTGNLKKN